MSMTIVFPVPEAKSPKNNESQKSSRKPDVLQRLLTNVPEDVEPARRFGFGEKLKQNQNIRPCLTKWGLVV